MSVVAKTKTSSFNLGKLASIDNHKIRTTEYDANDIYEAIDYEDEESGRSFIDIFSGLFGGKEEETGAVAASAVSSISNGLDETFKAMGIPEKYWEELNQLYNDIKGDGSTLSSVGAAFNYKTKIKEWLKRTDIPVAELLNTIVANQFGFDVKFTDEFIEKYGDKIVDALITIDIGAALRGEFRLELSNIIDKLQSNDIKTVGRALFNLFEIIDALDIPYDEIVKIFPGLADYLAGLVNINGLVINDETLKALWDSLTYYKDVWENDLSDITLDMLDKSTTTMDIVRALRNIYPSLFEVLDILGGEELTNYLLKTVIRKMPDILDDFMDLVGNLEGANIFTALGLIGDFISKYEIDIWQIVGGVGGQVFSPILDPISSAYDYVASGQILDDAWGLAQDVGGAIADTAVSTYDYFASGQVLEDVGSVIDEVGSWGIWIWNW